MKENINLGIVTEFELFLKEGGVITFVLHSDADIKLKDLVKVVLDEKSYYFEVASMYVKSGSVFIKANSTGYYNNARKVSSGKLLNFYKKSVYLVLNEDEIKEFERTRNYC